jgi:hypothetical protein
MFSNSRSAIANGLLSAIAISNPVCELLLDLSAYAPSDYWIPVNERRLVSSYLHMSRTTCIVDVDRS